MTEPVAILTIETDIHRFSVNAISRKTWAPMAGMRKTAIRLGQAAWIQAGKPRADRRVRLDVHVRRGTGKLMDEPNIWGALKGFIDGICRKALVPDDCPKWLQTGGITQESSKQHEGREFIRLTFTPTTPYDGKESLLWQKEQKQQENQCN